MDLNFKTSLLGCFDMTVQPKSVPPTMFTNNKTSHGLMQGY